MYIKSTPTMNFESFPLDINKIEFHSVRKDRIYLPYNGSLPSALSENDGAVISVNITAGLMVGVCLIITTGKKERRYSVEVTAQEVNDLLFPFFFKDVGNNKFHTRFENGLNDYWLGSYQNGYTNWKRLVLEEHGLDNLLFQLSPAAVERVLQHIKFSQTA